MKKLHDWFLENRRSFPWRQDGTPYRVWVSEVMLQQTRASAVIPYFLRWMEKFPDIATLAAMPIETVIKAWEGLGYYSRARNLHRGAKQVVERFGGVLPDRKEDLETIAGLGPYTVGAILSFGFKKRAAAVDGNVARVMSRYCHITDNLSKREGQKKIWEATEGMLDEREPWVTMEALIELGATLCTLKARCGICPLQLSCKGQHQAEYLPIKNEKKPITELKRVVTVIEAEGAILVRKQPKGQVMADLYEFPYFASEEEALCFLKPLGVREKRALSKTVHTFTRYKAHLYPLYVRVGVRQEIAGYEWILRDILASYPFSSGHRRILCAFCT